MLERITLTAQKRIGSGKGPARALRREGKIPAIVYGSNKEEIRIATNLRELNKQYERGHFTSKIINLDIDGTVIQVLPKQVQIDPVTDAPIHIDFYRVEKDSKIKVLVAVEFINADKSPGLKRGGVLNIVRRDVEFLAPIDSIPEKIIVDLDGKQIGETIHISHIKVPEGVVPTITDRDFTIATLVGRSASTADDEAAAGEGAAEATAEAGKPAAAAAKPGAAAKPAAKPAGAK